MSSGNFQRRDADVPGRIYPQGAHPKRPRKSQGKRSTTDWCAYDPPTDDDFRSQRTLEPNRDFGLSECAGSEGCRSLCNQQTPTRAASRSRNLQGSEGDQVDLGAWEPVASRKPGAKKSSHHTWWPYKAFDILANCEVMQMNHTIRPTKVLDYYDGVLVFTGRGRRRPGSIVGSIIETRTEGIDRYLVKDTLLRSGSKDLENGRY